MSLMKKTEYYENSIGIDEDDPYFKAKTSKER